jgi:hypothetical protein
VNVPFRIYGHPRGRARTGTRSPRCSLPGAPTTFSSYRPNHGRMYAELLIPLDTGPCVYRCWDARDCCLYVGWSSRHLLLRRMSDHMRDWQHRTQWWQDVARIDYLEFADDTAAQTEERRQIYLLRPQHNKVYNCGHDLSLPENYDAKDHHCLRCLDIRMQGVAAQRKAKRAEKRAVRNARRDARRDAMRAEWEKKLADRADRREAITGYAQEHRGLISDRQLSFMIATEFGGAWRTHQKHLCGGYYGPMPDRGGIRPRTARMGRPPGRSVAER